MNEVVNISNLTKQFKKQKAVNNVNIIIKEGEICGLVGKNGAGKTTLLKMLSGLSYPSSGKISVFGKDISKDSSVLKSTGAIIEDPGIFPNLTAYQNLKVKFIAIGEKDYKKIDDLLKLVELDKTGKKKAKNFSLGMKQRLGLALALAGEPKLLILDEPINGLDPQGIADIRNLILKINKERNTTIIISSHVLEEMTKIATDYIFIDNGVVLASMTKKELDDRCTSKIKLVVNDTIKAGDILVDMGFSDIRIIDDNNIEIYDHVDDMTEFLKALILGGVNVKNINNENESLEEFYFGIIGGKGNVK